MAIHRSAPPIDEDRGDGPGPEIRETHISWVMLAGDRAYKLLKPVTMPFLDLADRDVRLDAVERELIHNRRIAPDVYRGMLDIVEDGAIVDRMLVMRRLPGDRRLSALVGTERFSSCLREIARAVAALHSDADPIVPAPMASAEALFRNWEDNLAAMRPHVGSLLDEGDFFRIAALSTEYLAGRRRLIDERIAAGMVRDGHGDLRAEDIFCLDDGPRIIDCLAFDDDYRIGDVLLDIAFLVMDVERLAGRRAARMLLAWYQEFSGEHHPPTLAHHYVAYRAHVRAKIACLRHAQGDASSGDVARRYHAQALAHLERARVRCVLVGGGAGVGKSVLADGLAERFGFTVLSSDEIRKDVTGTPREGHRPAPPGEGDYRPEIVDAVYREQLREARVLLQRGESVVLDATWTHERHRRAARELTRSTFSELIELECVLAPAIAKERIARRLANPWNPSDATPDVVDHLAREREPWSTAQTIDTEPSPAAVLERAAAIVTLSRRRPRAAA